MARNIFISYKYKDNQVAPFLTNQLSGTDTIARNYVDTLQKYLKEDDHINLGEKDGESLEAFTNSTIRTRLKDKIRQSSITIVLISKGMKENSKPEYEQWIPWEISYSLRETTVQNRKSKRNAILGVVLPDENRSYNWYYKKNPDCNSTTHFTGQLFEMLNENMFNLKKPKIRECNGSKIMEGEFSYISTVKWSNFISTSNIYIEKAINIRDKADEYDL